MKASAQIKIRLSNGTSHWINEDDFEIRVTSHGYIMGETPYGKTVENILTFPQVVACIEEERNEWWREA